MAHVNNSCDVVKKLSCLMPERTCRADIIYYASKIRRPLLVRGHQAVRHLSFFLSFTFYLATYPYSINPQSEIHLLSHTHTPQSPKSLAKQRGARGVLFRPTGPPNPCGKTHKLWPGPPNPQGKTYTLWAGPPNPRGISHTVTPTPPQYGQRCSPDSPNMASIQPKTARRDPTWP
jgi:hypothetical protein